MNFSLFFISSVHDLLCIFLVLINKLNNCKILIVQMDAIIMIVIKIKYLKDST